MPILIDTRILISLLGWGRSCMWVGSFEASEIILVLFTFHFLKFEGCVKLWRSWYCCIYLSWLIVKEILSFLIANIAPGCACRQDALTWGCLLLHILLRILMDYQCDAERKHSNRISFTNEPKERKIGIHQQ